jgi:hypothetical protein
MKARRKWMMSLRGVTTSELVLASSKRTCETGNL